MAGSSTKSAQRGSEREQRFLRAGDGGEKFPAGKDADAAGRGGFGGHLFVFVSLRRAGGSGARCTAASRRSVTGVSVSGSSCVSSSPDCERCVSGSNLRMVSISSPKNSMRTGRSASGE